MNEEEEKYALESNKLDKLLQNANEGEYKLYHMFTDGSRYININDHPVFGYCRYYHFYEIMVKASAEGAHFVEIGSFMGQSSAIMAYLIKNSGKNIKFDCVDLFEISDFSDDEHEDYVGVYGGDMLKVFSFNLNKTGLANYINNVYKGTSLDTAKLYDDESLDMIYLDASHKYEDVIDDIKHWWPKLKVNGYLAGDDFDQKDVAKAVNDCFEDYETPDMGVFKHFGTWYVKKV
jgi:hypothetical protein